MNLKDRIQTFVKFGEFISNFLEQRDNSLNEEMEILNIKIKEAELLNNWFTRESILFSLKSFSNKLNVENFDAWLTPYDLSCFDKGKKVLIIMAGNIPLVGFHDLLSVIISGNKAVVKLSSNDNILFQFLWKVLCKINPSFIDKLQYIDDIEEKKFDAVIATGSNNSSKYFEYYFKNINRIIRKNRNSIAVLNGKESSSQLEGLSDDVFMYFGLGCRNVSKLFLPKGYDIDKLFKVFFSYKGIINHRKYSNNYDYNKTVFLMGNNKLVENGFILLKEDSSLQSPVSMLFYEFYEDLDKVKDYLFENKEVLQCVVNNENLVNKSTDFGETQNPELWDYADNIDTIDFLSKL